MQKHIISALKLVLTIAFVWVVYKYFIKINNPHQVWNAITNIPLWLFTLAFISSCINWTIEAIKWKFLMSNLEAMSLPNAIKSTLAGSTVSNIFPFRVGEYLGKIMFVKKENRIPAIFNSMFGSSSQMAISMLFGIPALVHLFGNQYQHLIQKAIILLLIVIGTFILIFTFSSKIKKAPKYWLQRIIDDVKKFSANQTLLALLFSLMRYLTFGSFYAYLLYYFGFGNTFLHSFTCVAAIYVIQSLAPGMILTDAGMRSAVPIIVFAPAVELHPQLVAIALVNYIFNLILPAIIGLYFIIVFKLKNR